MDINAEITADKYNIKSVERCLAILDIFAQTEEPITMQTICETLGFNSNMAFRMLATMVKAGYLDKDEKTGYFNVSIKSLPLSRKALMSLEVRRVAMPILDTFHDKYPKANLNLAVRYQQEIIIIGRIDSTSVPLTCCIPGKVLPFHASSLGKVLTCDLPENELDALIASKGLKPYTQNTITTPEALKEELAHVRRDQLSRDRSEFILGHNCNAIPLHGKNGTTVAAISLAAFDNFMSIQEIEDSKPALIEIGRNISYFMGFDTMF